MTPEGYLFALLIPLAVYILISGLDDIFISVCWLVLRRRTALPTPAERDAAPERRVAIFIPLWHEHSVAGQMLERTVSTLNYGAYDVFVGVYPNDTLTARVVFEASARDRRIRPAMVPHNGPTSKGDCLNWIFECMRRYETVSGARYEIIVTHDAEDVVHPESLRLINWFSRDHAMVQIPVLALPTSAREFTHGIYCDEFAEFQLKDIPVRQALGGFLPSNGVGCGFAREALERLAESRGGRIFDPSSLTEDYENGYQLHRLGYRQMFVPVTFEDGAPIATREYFPRHRAALAIRQRSRWIAGIALQGWERHGWNAPWRQRYWFFRDRKGVIGNLLSPFANAAFLAGLAGLLPIGSAPAHIGWLYRATLAIASIQMAARVRAAARIYGWRFAAFSPLRTLWGNLINFHATMKALQQFASAHLRGVTLSWQKTEHLYPTHVPAAVTRLRLGELLVRMRVVDSAEIEAALSGLPAGVRLGEHLVKLHKASRQDVYHALSAQSGIPFGAPAEEELSPAAARTLPIATAHRWRVLPYRIVMGQLHVATSEPPSEAMIRDLERSTTLELRFRLTAPEELEALERRLLSRK